MINWIKCLMAKHYMKGLVKKFDGELVDEAFRQKWVHMQGILLTKGNMKWNWKKVNGK